MKKRSLTLIATVLALSIVLSFFPSTVTAEDGGQIDVGGYKVTLSASPAYIGTVSWEPFDDDTIFVRAELTDVGRFGNWRFSGWTINGQENSSTSYLVYEVTSDTTIVARFEEQYDIKVSASPSEGGTVTGGGLYTGSTDATVNATPVTGWKFVHWKEGNDVITTEPNYSFTPDFNRSLTAVFERDPDYAYIAVVANPSEAGTVTGEGFHIKYRETKVTAEPAKGWRFVSWMRADEPSIWGTDDWLAITVFEDLVMVANFERDPDYAYITVTSNPTEGGTVEGGGYYKNGHTVKLTAGPAEGWKFTGWDEGGTVVSGDPQYSFTAETDRDLVADFAQLKYRVEFRNIDYTGFLLGGGEYGYGNTPKYTGKEPKRPADENYYYVFSGWDPALGPLTYQDDTVTYIYVAQYTQYDKYVLTEGAEGQYVLGSGVPLEFVFQPVAGDDPSAIDHFTGASVDDDDLTEGTDYTVKAGSVVLDLLPEYLDSLSAGNHTLKVQFDGRFDVDVDINIVVPADPNPKTGVGSNMRLYAGILIIAALAAFGLIAYRRKQNRMK